MDHDLRKLKLLVLLPAHILRNEGDTIFVVAKALPAPVHRLALLILVIKRTDSSVLADASIPKRAGAVVLPAQVQRLEEQQDGHAGEGHEQQNDLDGALALVQRVVDRAGLQEHVDEHVEQAGRRAAARSRPVDGPFIEYREDKIAEDGLKKDHARDEVAPDVDGGLEVPGVDV